VVAANLTKRHCAETKAKDTTLDVAGWARTTLACLAVWLLVLVGCHAEPRRTGDIDEIRSNGEIRVLVRPGYLRAPPSAAGQVDELVLLRQFAARLDVRLRVVECPRHDQIIPWLIEGRGDIAAGRFSPASLLGTGTSPSVPFDWVVDLLVASPKGGPAQFGEMAGREVHLPRSTLSPAVASALREGGLQVTFVPEEVTLEELLESVRGGRIHATVVDSVVLDRAQGRSQLRVVGPLSERRPLVWGLRESNPRLRRAVDDFLFAEQVLARTGQTASCRDLSQIRRDRVLRLVTRNSPTTCTVERGGLEGFEYDLALACARHLGVRLELAIPPQGVDPIDWLEQGFGDLAALHEPVAPEDEGRFLVTVPYRTVDLVSVVSRRRDPPAAVEDLAGVAVKASRPVASLCRMLPLVPAIDADTTGEGKDGLSALLHVARGQAEVAVVDSDTARLELANRPELQQGPTVLPDVPLVWIMNVGSQRLHDAVDSYLSEVRVSGLATLLARDQLGSWRPYVAPDLPDVPPGALTPYDELLKWVGRSHGIDWRLLASLMYEESKFDPDAVGPGGSAGLFQFMPFVWSELGVDDPHHPAEAAEAGAWYLDWLMDRFSDLELPDRVALAIASYNVGPRHVFDARRLARQMGLDPNRWAGNVETAMLILDDPDVARGFPAGVCRCRRAVGYTRRILRRYRAYTEQFPPA
jgi:membrane-bound lytic murein transglycosylase F